MEEAFVAAGMIASLPPSEVFLHSLASDPNYLEVTARKRKRRKGKEEEEVSSAFLADSSATQ